MWPIESIRKLMTGNSVNHVLFTGDKQVTKIQYIGPLERQPNSTVNAYDLLGYEIYSDTLEIINESGLSLGLGYVADIAGITVNLDRKVSEHEVVFTIESSAAAEPDREETEGPISYTGEVQEGKKTPDLSGTGKEKTVPCVILRGKEKVTSLQFGYVRKIRGALINDKTGKRYEIKSAPTEITGTDGKTGIGYVIDEALRRTIVINREITVQKITKDKTVEIHINWSGMVGKQATSDILTNFLDLGQSLTAKYIFGFMMLFLGFIIGKML